MSENQYRFLAPTRALFQQIKNVLLANEMVSVALWDTLKEMLLAADLGPATSMWIIQRLRWRRQEEELRSGSQVYAILRQELVQLLGYPSPLRFSRNTPVTIMMVIGEPGSGKTTSIAKLTYRLIHEGRSVLIVSTSPLPTSADPPLSAWDDQIHVPIIGPPDSHTDTKTVVYDALQAAQDQHRDVMIIDTSNHTTQQYRTEWKDITSAIGKAFPGTSHPHEILLTVDAMQGQASRLSLRRLAEDSGLTGAILTRADNTAKGGYAFAITDDLGIPIKFLGTGEKSADLVAFDPEHFIAALLDEE